MDATWKVGAITVPSSPGDVAVTGFGGTPAAMFFFGTNWLTEDTADTSTGLGIFRGMAAPKYDDPGTLLQNSQCLHPGGAANLELNEAILMLTPDMSGAGLYQATVTFDADGFTASFFNATAGGYQVVYVALMDVANVGAFVGTMNQAGLAYGFKAGGALMHGGWQGPIQGNLNQTEGLFGSAAYPGTDRGDWQGGGFNQHVFPATIGSQYYQSIDVNLPDVLVTHGVNFIGPFLAINNLAAYPTGGGLTDLAFLGATDDGGMIVAWDDEDNWVDFQTTPTNTDDQTTVSGLPFAPGLVMGYTISIEPNGQSSGSAPGAVGLSVATPDFQWAATVEGTTASRGAFQSFQRGFCDTVNGTDVHAGTIAMTSDGFVMTTVEDAAGPETWVYHALGHPRTFSWIPHIYRLVRGPGISGRAAPAPPPEGFLLLEDGDQIILEDGSGFLRLG